MKNLVIFISLLSIGAFGCHKDSVPNYPVDADLKAAFNFKVGSYWIYIDSISGQVDSYFVRENILQNLMSLGSPSYRYDEIVISIKKSNINNYAVDTLGWTLIYSKNLISLGDLDVRRIGGGILEYDPLSAYPFDTNLTLHYAPLYTPVVNLYGSYLINGQNFNNVEVINCIKNLNAAQNYPLGTAYNSNNWFYLCPNVGFIKIVINQPQDSIFRVWELQRYHIVN